MDTLGATVIASGTTPEQVSLRRTEKGIFVLSLNATEVNKENRWTLEFTIAVHKAFDAIEEELEKDPQGTPAALLTISQNAKFFSNGIDPEALMNPPPGFDFQHWNALVMPAFARPLLLPIPTVCCVNGHAFGAGMMFAVGHDYRLQNSERGYICAIEIAIGIETPPPELTLFRHSMPVDAFQESMLTARRWNGVDAEKRGVVHKCAPAAELLGLSMKKAVELSALGKNRKLMGRYKAQLKGFVAEEILSYTFPNGKSPTEKQISPGLLKHVEAIVAGGSMQKTWGVVGKTRGKL